MTVNIAFIVAILIVIALAGLGVKRGLIMSIYYLAATVLILVLTFVIDSPISKYAKTNEKIYNMFYGIAEDMIDLPDTTAEDVDSYLEGSDIPESLRGLASDASEAIAENAGGSIGDRVQTYLRAKLTDIIITCLAFVISFAISVVVVLLVFKGLDLVSKVPVVNTANKIGGLMIGLVEGIIIVWVLCGLVRFIAGTEFGTAAIEQISENVYLKFFYEHNLLTEIISGHLLADAKELAGLKR